MTEPNEDQSDAVTPALPVPPLGYLLPNLPPDHLCQLVERLGELGWVISSRQDPGSLAILWSATGAARMAEIQSILKRWTPGLFNGSGKAWKVAALIGIWQIDRLLKRRDQWNATALQIDVLNKLAISNSYAAEGKETEFYYSSLEKLEL